MANLSVLGYNLDDVYEGRGVLEAASMGVAIASDEMAMRCNLICIKDGIIKNHSAGHISNEEAEELIHFLENELGNDFISFHSGVSYRHLLKIKNGCKELDCTPPHDVPGKPYRPLLVKALSGKAQDTANLINQLIVNHNSCFPITY